MGSSRDPGAEDAPKPPQTKPNVPESARTTFARPKTRTRFIERREQPTS